jgi:plasmid maintenance system antidote protein VapI
MIHIISPIGGNQMNRFLKAKIIEKFGTQSDFAVKAKVDDPTVSRVVRNRKTLTPEDQYFWARLLDSEPEELFN